MIHYNGVFKTLAINLNRKVESRFKEKVTKKGKYVQQICRDGTNINKARNKLKYPLFSMVKVYR